VALKTVKYGIKLVQFCSQKAWETSIIVDSLQKNKKIRPQWCTE